MLLLSVLLIALSAMAVVLFVAEVAPGRRSQLVRRLAELEGAAVATSQALRRRRRQAQAQKLAGVIEAIGEKSRGARRGSSDLRLNLLQAGFGAPNAVPLYLGFQVSLPITFGLLGMLLTPLLGGSLTTAGFVGIWGAVLGYVLPAVYVGTRRRERQREMQRALPDALDLLVVCVEAGLALNQALMRVAEETDRLSRVLSEHLTLVNLEIRAGTRREDALRSLGERTGVDDLKSLVAMLIQTDRFGTSIGTALRVHADTLRTKRRQRAEEMAAKTTIKLVFPLVLLILPAMFVVILGPALIRVLDTLQQLRP